MPPAVISSSGLMRRHERTDKVTTAITSAIALTIDNLAMANVPESIRPIAIGASPRWRAACQRELDRRDHKRLAKNVSRQLGRKKAIPTIAAPGSPAIR